MKSVDFGNIYLMDQVSSACGLKQMPKELTSRHKAIFKAFNLKAPAPSSLKFNAEFRFINLQNLIFIFVILSRHSLNSSPSMYALVNNLFRIELPIVYPYLCVVLLEL